MVDFDRFWSNSIDFNRGIGNTNPANLANLAETGESRSSLCLSNVKQSKNTDESKMLIYFTFKLLCSPRFFPAFSLNFGPFCLPLRNRGYLPVGQKIRNFGLKSNGKVIFREFHLEIVDYLQRYSSISIRNRATEIFVPFGKFSSFQSLISRKH